MVDEDTCAGEELVETTRVEELVLEGAVRELETVLDGDDDGDEDDS